jgi:predicted subunit of tRNA(5-methylaminomethyl-2-thiouridylate) methyltransferase
VALDSVSRIDGPGHRSKPKRILSRLHGMFLETSTQAVADHPRDFETETRAMLRQLELAMRETYFHPSKVPANVIGDEGRAMPQQQQ